MLEVFRLNFSDSLFSDVRAIRQSVFVEEQGVSSSKENDEFEQEAFHYLLRYNSRNIGAARRRTTSNGIKLERFAILKKFRGRGMGKKLVKEVLMDVKDSDKQIYLHAQIQVVDFYENLNFVIEGELFEEAGINHYKMIFKSP
ncbi:MAG: GNAT family N-acetyltransferase [Flavobacteriales bacterium]|nr:GNAT family N-acetyltransferase [Flavobacteriales bacterium]MBL6872943.1 GNAT family N-acetyltransferase [Flavobacteriales bacterium]